MTHIIAGQWEGSRGEGTAANSAEHDAEAAVQENSCATLTLFAIPEFRSSEFVINSQTGAGTLSVAMHQLLALWLVRVYRLAKNGRRERQ